MGSECGLCAAARNRPNAPCWPATRWRGLESSLGRMGQGTSSLAMPSWKSWKCQPATTISGVFVFGLAKSSSCVRETASTVCAFASRDSDSSSPPNSSRESASGPGGNATRFAGVVLRGYHSRVSNPSSDTAAVYLGLSRWTTACRGYRSGAGSPWLESFAGSAPRGFTTAARVQKPKRRPPEWGDRRGRREIRDDVADGWLAQARLASKRGGQCASVQPELKP